MIAAIESVAKKYNNVGYNKAALAFIEAGGNDTQNHRCKAVNTVVAISPNDELLLPCYHFAQTGIPIMGNFTNFIVSRERWKITANPKVSLRYAKAAQFGVT